MESFHKKLGPAPKIEAGKPIVSNYPSPKIADRIFRIRKDSTQADYVVPSPGDPYVGVKMYEELLEGFQFSTSVPAQDPTYTGMVDHYYLNERANSNSYNFEITYPYTDKDYPKITRTYVFLRAGFTESVNADDTDPIFEELLLTDHKIIRLQDPILDGLFIGIERTYERLPGPVITTYEENQFQQPVVVLTQEVVSSTQPAITATTERSTQERATTAKAKNTKADTASVFPQNIYQKERPEGVLPFNMRTAVPGVTTSQVQAGTAAAPTMADSDWTSEEQQLTVYKKLVKVTARVLPGGQVILNRGRQITKDQQLATVIATWKDDNQTLTPSALLIAGHIDDVGNNQTVKEETTVPDLFDEISKEVGSPEVIPLRFRAASGISTDSERVIGTVTAGDLTLDTGEVQRKEAQETKFIKRVTVTKKSEVITPTLEGQDRDPKTGLAIRWQERLEDSGTSLDDANTEVTPISDELDIAKEYTEPDNSDLAFLNRTYNSVVNHVFPDYLPPDSVELVEAYVDSGDDASYDAEVVYDIIRGYRGPCDGTTEELYTHGPPSSGSIPAITKFFPQEHQRSFAWWAISSSGQTQARVVVLKIPFSLHPEITLTSDFALIGSFVIPSTEPDSLPAPGTLIAVDVKSELWRDGIFRTEITRVKVP